MDAEKIVENMKAVLKKAKRKRSNNKNKQPHKNINGTLYIDEDKEISELMNKNWQMKTPPVNKKEIVKEGDAANQKVNAFEKMMSNQKLIISPDITPEYNAKVNGKYNKKHNKKILNKFNNDTESSIKKRTRINDACLQNSSKKRKINELGKQLESNENHTDNSVERPKRSCASKIDYSLFANSPEKDSPEKIANKIKSETTKMTKVTSTDEKLPIKQLKENVKLAPLFTNKTNKHMTESRILKKSIETESFKHQLDTNDNSIDQKDIHIQQRDRRRKKKSCANKISQQHSNDSQSSDQIIIESNENENAFDETAQSSRPRRSCANVMDYSQLIDSPEKSSLEKRPLRSKSDCDNIVKNLEADKNAKRSTVFDVKTVNESQVDDISNQETTLSGRPKRSCINKIDYSKLLDSPDKKSPEKKTGNAKFKTEKNDDVIYVDENSPNMKKSSVKLAPLFVKKLPKPAIDPAILEARRNFLLSELPASLRAPIEKQRQFVDEILSNDMVVFPKVSHITQLKDEYEKHAENLFDKSKIRINEMDMNELPLESDMIIKCGSLTSCCYEDYTPSNNVVKKESKLVPLSDIKEAVRKIKESCGSFPVNRCFKQILSKLKVAKENDEENGISYLNSSFVEIFKPTSFDEVLIGLEPAKRLQEFLNTWNDRNSKSENYDSDDSSSRHSMKGLNNCAVLSGQNGSGKTSSVFALANDLNYEVIEINAGSRRSGKKILQDLLEATQSHRVEKNLMDDEASSDNFKNDTVDRKTIILIEDAELTFENDDGFISSIQQLINISKRPVILTTNDYNCQHLQKFIQHNEIIYDSPKNYVTKYLALISVATANYQIDEEDIEYLYSFNRCDLRKTINEIEFFIRSENASANSGCLMGLFCDTKNKNRLQKGQLAFHSQRDLSTLRFRSSIISDYSALLSCSQQVFEGGEISYHQHNLMNEMANFFKQSNLLKMEYQNDFAQSERQQIISRSISNEVCPMNTNTQAKHVDYSPLLRHICRSEKTRDISRRTNRSHYLRHHLSNTLNANEYFNTQCSIFQEDNE